MNNLHKEGRWLKVIAKEAGCLHVFIESWVEGKHLVWKVHQHHLFKPQPYRMSSKINTGWGRCQSGKSKRAILKLYWIFFHEFPDLYMPIYLFTSFFWQNLKIQSIKFLSLDAQRWNLSDILILIVAKFIYNSRFWFTSATFAYHGCFACRH